MAKETISRRGAIHLGLGVSIFGVLPKFEESQVIETVKEKEQPASLRIYRGYVERKYGVRILSIDDFLKNGGLSSILFPHENITIPHIQLIDLFLDSSSKNFYQEDEKGKLTIHTAPARAMLIEEINMVALGRCCIVRPNQPGRSFTISQRYLQNGSAKTAFTTFTHEMTHTKTVRYRFEPEVNLYYQDAELSPEYMDFLDSTFPKKFIEGRVAYEPIARKENQIRINAVQSITDLHPEKHAGIINERYFWGNLLYGLSDEKGEEFIAIVSEFFRWGDDFFEKNFSRVFPARIVQMLYDQMQRLHQRSYRNLPGFTFGTW